ncbi:MAG: extracellular solute-binding protein, partial [Gammaproteobacteria bacterium]
MRKSIKILASSAIIAVASSTAVQAGELTIATVNNGHMIKMQGLTHHFEAANPGVTVNWVTLDEGTLRSRVTTDIATKGGQFDVMTIGMYEAPMWGA